MARSKKQRNMSSGEFGDRVDVESSGVGQDTATVSLESATPLFDFSSDEGFSLGGMSRASRPQKPGRSTSKVTSLEDQNAVGGRANVSLLANFWELDEEEERTPEQEREEQRVNEFFSDSLSNSKSTRRALDEAVSKRIRVGLYPSDAALLEELFQQSKAAGLKNVSRARILRVALRHFHTCWLNADKS